MSKPSRVESTEDGDRESVGRALSGSPDFLQSVIDAFPDSIIVIDRNYRVVLANRTAREKAGLRDPLSGCLRCYEISHHRDRRCDIDDKSCPLHIVTTSKAPATVVHTHYESGRGEVHAEITAAPIMDEAGDVAWIVESCRDISDRKRAARFLEITNRHMGMKPLIEEFTAELKRFTRCAVAGISILDEPDLISSCSLDGVCGESHEWKLPVCIDGDLCVCRRVVKGEVEPDLPYCTEDGSIYLDCETYRLAMASDKEIKQLHKACERCGYNSFALVPIRLGSRVLGLIFAGDSGRSAVSRQMVEALERVALELATAIQRVKTEEALRTARDELETRVQQRTADLTRANQALEDEIAERTRLEREILKISAQEQQRIGQELHDGLGQELTGLSYLATSLHQKLLAKELTEVKTSAELARGIPSVVSRLRRIVRGLIPLEIDAEDLKPALEALMTNAEEQSGISCHFDGDRRAQVKNGETALQIYRIAQEAVANALRHAHAGQIVASLKAKGERTELAVRDDGVGIQADAESGTGSGLSIMRYRARAIGGSLEVQSQDKGGTLVACVFCQE